MKTKSKVSHIKASIEKSYVDYSFISDEVVRMQEIVLDRINPKTGLISRCPIINIVILN